MQKQFLLRLTLTILIGVTFIIVYGQTNFQKEILLTTDEASTLNSIFLKNRNDFDFNGKLVGFSVGTTGTHIVDKKLFFKEYINPIIDKKSKNVCSLIILTKTEKSKSGGFDAIVLSPVKIFTKKHKQILINELNKLTMSYKEQSIND
jgi:hypothetical protein